MPQWRQRAREIDKYINVAKIGKHSQTWKMPSCQCFKVQMVTKYQGQHFAGWRSISSPSTISSGLEVIYTMGGGWGGTCWRAPISATQPQFTLQTPSSEFNTWTLLPAACPQESWEGVGCFAFVAKKGSGQQAVPGGRVRALPWCVDPQSRQNTKKCRCA